jgi:hypothetical protein
MLFFSVAALLHTPYPPTPFHPRQGGKGSLTTLFDVVAPNALLRSQGCHGCYARRLCANGRSGRVAIARANGGRVAARSGCTNLRPFTTTAGSPTPAPTSASQAHACSTVFGAKRPNVVLSSPLARRGERGWGRVGETKATRKSKATRTSKVAKQSTLSKGENT